MVSYSLIFTGLAFVDTRFLNLWCKTIVIRPYPELMTEVGLKCRSTGCIFFSHPNMFTWTYMSLAPFPLLQEPPTPLDFSELSKRPLVSPLLILLVLFLWSLVLAAIFPSPDYTLTLVFHSQSPALSRHLRADLQLPTCHHLFSLILYSINVRWANEEGKW